MSHKLDWATVAREKCSRRLEIIDNIRDEIYSPGVQEEDVADLVTAMLRLMLIERDIDVRSSLLDAIGNLASYRDLDIQWYDYASVLMPRAEEEIEFCVDIMGETGDPRFIPAVQQYESHKDSSTRATVAEALYQLRRT